MLSKFRDALLCYRVANINHGQPAGVSRYRREVPPAHHSLKIQSFSSVREKCLEFYSDVFENRGHKWRLCLYPKGKNDDNISQSNKKENAYLSLYLEIVETDCYASGWQVHVNFKLFVYDKKHDNYLTMQDANGLVRCFEEKKKQWGFSQLISYKDFYDPSNGFLVYDSCAFGAEVFVVQSSIVLERPPDQYPKQCPNIFTWDVKDFTKKDNWIYIESENFEVGGMAWTVSVYPKGYSSGSYGRKGILAMCLYLHHAQNDLPASETISVNYKMRILNKDDFDKNLETTSSDPIVFSKVGSGQYDENIIALKDLQQPTNGFIKNDTITVQVEILVL